MDQGRADVIVSGVRCQVVKNDGERMLIKPMTASGFGINVKRWVSATDASPMPTQAKIPMVLSDEEIRHLAAVLRQVFREDAESRTQAMTN
ncbi:MAG: hypothetical protein H7338_13120 [Candidatus Sericytochromatia bacterium]|nr:hypothetical protein [Candidatus Sericytochromatia bacterium]